MSKKIQIDVDINTKNASNSVGELNNYLNNSLSTIDELRETSAALNEELAKTEIGSEAFNNLSNQLKVVNSELMATEDNIKVLSNDEINSNLKGMATGLTDFAGGLALIGVSGGGLEQIAQTFAKVQGASKVATGAFEAYTMGMKVVQGITQAATTAQTKLAASTATATTATAAQGNVSTIAAIKMRVLNLVMSANPVFLLIGGITALVGALYLFSDRTETATDENEKFNKSLEKTKSNSENFTTSLNKNTQQRIDLMKAQGKTQEEINEVIIDGAKKQIEFSKIELEDTQKKIIGLKERYDINKRLNSEESRERNVKLKEQINETKKYYAEQKVLLEDSKNSILLVETQTNTDITDKQKEANKKYAEENKRKNDELLNAQMDYMKQLQLLLSQLRDEEELNLENDEINRLDILDKREKEKANIIFENFKETVKNRKDADKLIEEQAKVHSQIVIEIEEDTQRKKDDIIKRRINENKIRDNQTLINEIKANEQIELANAKTEEEKYEIRVKYANMLKDLEKERLRIQMEIDIKSVEGTENAEAKKAAIRAKYNLDIATLDNTKTEEKAVKDEEEKQAFTDKQQFMMDTAIQFAQAATDAISTILDNRAIAEQAKIDERYNYENESLKSSLANREISQAEYDTKVELLNKRKEQQDLMARRKAFNSAKKMQLIQANISGAQAVLAAVSSGMAVPIIGPATAAVYASIAGALSAVQIGAIASQKFQAARGGVVPGQASMTDSVDAFLAPGEMVINSNSAKMFAPILSDINMAGGGIPLAPQQPKNDSGSNANGNQTVTAVVIESDITDSQRRINRYERRKEF